MQRGAAACEARPVHFSATIVLMMNMMDGVVITTYEHAAPPRVMWVVLKKNRVEGSGVELAQAVALDAAREAAVEQAKSCALAAGFTEPLAIEYWTGISGNK